MFSIFFEFNLFSSGSISILRHQMCQANQVIRFNKRAQETCARLTRNRLKAVEINGKYMSNNIHSRMDRWLRIPCIFIIHFQGSSTIPHSLRTSFGALNFFCHKTVDDCGHQKLAYKIYSPLETVV